jgi:hypothetical protein
MSMNREKILAANKEKFGDCQLSLKGLRNGNPSRSTLLAETILPRGCRLQRLGGIYEADQQRKSLPALTFTWL